MKKFLQSNSGKINGILQSFDRIIIKGYIKPFYYSTNFYYFLTKENIQLKDYKDYTIFITMIVSLVSQI